jgi:hypothetical protein
MNMYQERNTAHVRCALLLLCLIALETRRTLAQEQQYEQGEKVGTISSDRPFLSVTDTDNFLLPTKASESGGVQRLPPVEPPKSEPPAFGFGPEMGMGPGGGQGPISYRTFWFPSVPVKGQSGDWGLAGQDFSLAYPLWIDLPNTLMITAGVKNRMIDTDAILPDSHKAYPSELWNAQVGLMYMRQLSGDRMLGGGVTLGSASDHPFASINEMNVSMNAMYRIPSGEHNAWMFMLMYSPMGEIAFPIPGVFYSYNPSDQFHANIGLPFMFTYKPTDRWTFEASYMLIHTIHVKATYKIAERLNVFGGYDWSNESYMLEERTNDKDRFFLYDQRVTLGLEIPVTSWLTAQLIGGYAFDRYSFIGQQWNSTGTDRVDIDPGPFVSLSVSIRR